MTGVTDLPSLSLLDINHQLNQSDPNLKLRESHFGLPSQKAMGEFAEFLTHWRMPWDEESGAFYEFDHFAHIRQVTRNFHDDEPPIDVINKDCLTPADIQLLQKDRFQLFFRGKVLSVAELFTSSLEQGLTKQAVITRCGYAEWDNMVSHLRHKQSFRKMRAVISEVQRMQFENYMEKFSEEDFYLYLEYKTYLSWESERYERDKAAWKQKHDGLQRDIQECEAMLEELDVSIAQKTKRQKRLSFLKKSESKDSGEAGSLAVELEKLVTLKKSTEAKAVTARAQLEQEAQKQNEFVTWHKTIKWHSDELTLLEYRQQLEINRLHMKIIDEARNNDYPEAQQQRIDERYQVLQEESEKLHEKIRVVTGRLEPKSAASIERSTEDPQYGKFQLTPTASQYLTALKKAHPALPEEFKEVRELLLTQSKLVNYTGEELHQHFRLRLQPFRHFITVSKIEFEDRVSRSWWRRLLNLLRNIRYGWIHKDTEEAFRNRYHIVKQEYHEQMHQWADAVLSRFEANEHTHIAAMSSQYQYSDVAVNAYQSLEKMNVALPRLHVIESEQERDSRTAYVVTSRQDLTPETMSTLRADLTHYLNQINEDLISLQKKQKNAKQKQSDYEGRSAQQYQDEIEKLELTRQTILKRQNAIPCLATPEILTDDQMETETWAQDPDILLAVNTIQHDLSKKPEDGKSLLDQLNHRGEPEWLASANKKLANAQKKLERVQETEASNPVYIKVKQTLDTLREDYELAKLASNVKVARDQEIDSIITNPSSSQGLYLRQERCRRAAMALEGRDRSDDVNDQFEAETFYPPELVPKLLEYIGDGKLLNLEGRFDSIKTKHVLTVINECVDPKIRSAMMELMICLVNRDDAYEKLHATLVPLTELVNTQPPLIERLWKTYFIPRLTETGNVNLALCIRTLSPHLLDEFMKTQSQNTTWALERLSLLLEKPREIGQSLPTAAVEQNWELIDDQLLSTSVQWVNLADGLGQLAAVERVPLRRKFREFATKHYDGTETHYHRLYSATLVRGEPLQAYWAKRLACVMRANPADLSDDQCFMNSLDPEGLAQVESDLIRELQKNSLSKDDGLLRLATLCPGVKITGELVELYQRAYHAKQFHICTKLTSLLKGVALQAVSAFHQTCLMGDLLEIRPLSEQQRNCIAHSAEGQRLIEQTTHAAAALKALKGNAPEAESLVSGNWIETFGRLNLSCIFEYLELIPNLKIPDSTLEFIETHFTNQHLEENKSDLDSEYVRYHNIIEALERAQVRYHRLSSEPTATKLQTLKDHFNSWRNSQPAQLFELILANLKEKPLVLSEFFQYVREEFLVKPDSTLVKAFFSRLNQPDFASLDSLEPYRATARTRLELELSTSMGDLSRELGAALALMKSQHPSEIRDFFMKEPQELLAIKAGKYATSTTRSALLFEAASAILKCDDGVTKSLLRKFCFAVSSPYQALDDYQSALSLYQTYQKSQRDLQAALTFAKNPQFHYTDFSKTSILSLDIYKESFQRSIREALSQEAKPVEALNRLCCLSGFALAIPTEPKLLEECGALLLKQLKALMLEDILDDDWFTQSLSPLADALRTLPTLPYHAECIKVVEQAITGRALYQRYLNGAMKGQLSGLTFHPQEADQLATVFPQESLVKLQEQLALIATKIQDKTDPSFKILEIFSERLRGEKLSDADSMHQQFLAQRHDAIKHSQCYAFVDKLSKNLLVVDLQTPKLIRDLLMHMPLQTQMDTLRFIAYRLQNLVFNTLNLSDKAQGLSTLICPSPEFTRRCYQQLGEVLGAFSILEQHSSEKAQVRNDVAQEFFVVKLIQLGRQDVLGENAIQACSKILGLNLTSDSINERIKTVLFSDSEYDPEKTPDSRLWVALRDARIQQRHHDALPAKDSFTEEDVLSAQYRHLKTSMLSNSFLSRVMQDLVQELDISRSPEKMDPRSQAYHARDVLNQIYLVDSLQDPSSVEALQGTLRSFKQRYLEAIQQSKSVACGEYFAALVLGHYERSKGKNSFARAIGLQSELLDAFNAREKLTLVGLWKQQDGIPLSDEDQEFIKRKEEIQLNDNRCTEHFMRVTLPQCRQSEAISEELKRECISEENEHALAKQVSL